jgi:hypothetical protein
MIQGVFLSAKLGETGWQFSACSSLRWIMDI